MLYFGRLLYNMNENITKVQIKRSAHAQSHAQRGALLDDAPREQVDFNETIRAINTSCGVCASIRSIQSIYFIYHFILETNNAYQ